MSETNLSELSPEWSSALAILSAFLGLQPNHIRHAWENQLSKDKHVAKSISSTITVPISCNDDAPHGCDVHFQFPENNPAEVFAVTFSSPSHNLNKLQVINTTSVLHVICDHAPCSLWRDWIGDGCKPCCRDWAKSVDLTRQTLTPEEQQAMEAEVIAQRDDMDFELEALDNIELRNQVANLERAVERQAGEIAELKAVLLHAGLPVQQQVRYRRVAWMGN